MEMIGSKRGGETSPGHQQKGGDRRRPQSQRASWRESPHGLGRADRWSDQAPGAEGDVINWERWVRNRWGHHADGAGDARWLEVEMLDRSQEIPVGNSRSRSEMKLLIWKTTNQEGQLREPEAPRVCPKLTPLFFPEPLSSPGS